MMKLKVKLCFDSIQLGQIIYNNVKFNLIFCARWFLYVVFYA